VFGKLSDEEVKRRGFPASLLKRRATNSSIHRYYVADSKENVLYLEDVPSYASLPESVRNYLEEPPNEAALKARAAYKRGDCKWWRFTFPLHKELHIGPRRISPYRTGHNRFSLDRDFSYFTSTDTTIIFPRKGVKEDLRYIQALLNSKLLTFRFRGLGKLTSPNMWESLPYTLADVPIRRINFAAESDRRKHDAIVQRTRDVENARSAAFDGPSAADRSLGARRSEAFMEEIDRVVLDLYGITDAQEQASVLALGSPR